jgi:predicted nucleotidyltransferase
LEADWTNTLVRRLTERYPLSKIVLFGSRARGDASASSDVDLLLVLPEAANKRQIAVEARRLLADLPVSKDIIVTTPAEIERDGDLIGGILRPALREGTNLYECQQR